MKYIVAAFICLHLFAACRQSSSKPLIDPVFCDSLISHYQPSPGSMAADSNLLFWQSKMQAMPDNFLNGPKYAGALVSSFRLHGTIEDLVKADSLMQRSNLANGEKEPSLFRTLASLALLQHKFLLADSLLMKAVAIDGNNVPNAYLNFDISFERGQYEKARKLLGSLSADKSYAWYFRKSKFEHYSGTLDSSISYMMQAAARSANNKSLLQTALSNAADLHVHKGNLEQARDLYIQSIHIDASDIHSIMGLGWIALVHDRNDTLAERLFQFVRQRSQAPDALLKLEQVAEQRGDTILQLKYAKAFVREAERPVYGKMYGKYLIDLYTGILNDPLHAVKLAEEETVSRPAPQMFAWLAWSLYCSGQKERAYKTFTTYVSNKPLEGLELYYMGRMMKGLDKGYNAQQFFKAAYKNRYDLSPEKVKYLDENLE
jgi:Tfp pilus assembly protein PilF